MLFGSARACHVRSAQAKPELCPYIKIPTCAKYWYAQGKPILPEEWPSVLLARVREWGSLPQKPLICGAPPPQLHPKSTKKFIFIDIEQEVI